MLAHPSCPGKRSLNWCLYLLNYFCLSDSVTFSFRTFLTFTIDLTYHLKHTQLSRVCVVAQYAALEANAKVNGISEISHPYPSQTLGPICMPFQIYHYVRPGVDVQNLI